MLEAITRMKTADARDALLEPERKSESEKRGRKASKEVRQLQLIEATIDSLARRGYSETTMADVANGAGLSRGIVNFHFESKEKLLVATLRHMTDEYLAHWRQELARAGGDPAHQLRAMLTASLDRKICSVKRLSALRAFLGEGHALSAYRKIWMPSVDAYAASLHEICAKMEDRRDAMDSKFASFLLFSTLDGIRLRLSLRVDAFDHRQALDCLEKTMKFIFPRSFA